jgi:hypothetical protein
MGSYAKKLLDIYDDWERRVRADAEAQREVEGRAKGRVIGLRKGFVICYRARFGDVPAELSAVVEAMNDADTLLRWVELCATAPARDIAAALASAAPSS